MAKKTQRRREPGQVSSVAAKAIRSTPALPAVVISDQTAFAVVGLDARQFRRFLRENNVAHTTVHRHPLARLDDFLAALDRLSGAEQRSDWSEERMIARATGRVSG